MDTAAVSVPLSSTRAGVRELAARLGGPSVWALAFALTLYLGWKGGGYDAIVRDEVGIAVWWVVLLAAILGAIPVVRPTKAAWAALALLAAFAVWTAIGISWSGSSERSVTELARV